jgi:hypothetical protein
MDTVTKNFLTFEKIKTLIKSSNFIRYYILISNIPTDIKKCLKDNIDNINRYDLSLLHLHFPISYKKGNHHICFVNDIMSEDGKFLSIDQLEEKFNISKNIMKFNSIISAVFCTVTIVVWYFV